MYWVQGCTRRRAPNPNRLSKNKIDAKTEHDHEKTFTDSSVKYAPVLHRRHTNVSKISWSSVSNGMSVLSRHARESIESIEN